MKKIIFLILFLLSPSLSFAMPAFPMAFWGNVSINNSSAPVGTVIRAYYSTSTLVGQVTVNEAGVYGYDNALLQKLLIAEGSGTITFKFQTFGINSGQETSGCGNATYNGFSSGITLEKDLIFYTTGCDSVGDVSSAKILSVNEPQIIITDSNATTTLVVNSNVSNPTIDVSAFIGANGTGTVPAIVIDSPIADVTIPASTLITSASTTWNGVLAAPVVTTVTLPTESGVTKTLSTAIEVGFLGVALTFDKAVKLVIPNQSDKRVGYTRDGGTTFTEITTTCTTNSQAWADANLAAGGDCKTTSGSDLVIWTKHFTSFAAYSQTTNQVGGGGGGGGGGWFPAPAAPVIVASSTTATTTISTSTSATSISLIDKSTVYSFNFTRDLQSGLTGDDVTALQKILVYEGYLVMPEGVNYGKFGALTREALAKFQKARNISPALGYFGSKTRKLLASLNTPIAKVQEPIKSTPTTNNVASAGLPVIKNAADMSVKDFLKMLLQAGAIPSNLVEAVKNLIQSN